MTAVVASTCGPGIGSEIRGYRRIGLNRVYTPNSGDPGRRFLTPGFGVFYLYNSSFLKNFVF